jgi:PadR family transcriptional regulator, regulatory protein PadR
MAKNEPRLSHQALLVFRLFLDQPKNWFAGSDIWKHTGILSGTLYPILMRFERAGWLKSRWEQLDPSEAGRPRKRLYTVTPQGYNNANKALAELGVPNARRAWNS